MFTTAVNGLPVPIGEGFPTEGSVLYQLIVPPLPVAVNIGAGSFTQTWTRGLVLGGGGCWFTMTSTVAGWLSHPEALLSVTQ